MGGEGVKGRYNIVNEISIWRELQSRSLLHRLSRESLSSEENIE